MLAAALALIVLDGTVVAVALPTIVADLHLDLTDAQWVNSLYSMVFAALLLTAGRLGDRLGRRRVLLVGLGVFAAGSALAAAATGVEGLLAARALQGVGGALVLPSTLSAVNATFRGRDRAAAFGIWGAVMSGAAAIGPLLGGWLTQVASWPLIFWVNVPLVAAVAVAARLFVQETRSPARKPGVDVAGPVISGVGLALVVFGLIESTALGWWRPVANLTVLGVAWPAGVPLSPVPVALAVGTALLVAFVVVEWRRGRAGRAAVLDLRMFSIGTFVAGNITAGLVAVGEFALLFALPLFLVISAGLSPLGAGLVLASMATGAFISGATARHLAARFGPARVVTLGLALEVLGAAATAASIGSGTPVVAIVAALMPYGLGLGLASAQLTSTTLRDVPTAQSGAGSATQSTVRQLGTALGSALGGTTLAAALARRPGDLAGADPSSFAAASASSVWAGVAVLLLALTSSIVLDRKSRAAALPPQH